MQRRPLVFWELSPSPNSVKLRMALAYKGVPFEVEPVDPFDRAPLLALSGQELSPVVHDGAVVLNDSEAILQYLDANYTDTPRLFPRLRDGRRACDAWKRRMDASLSEPWLPGFMYSLRRREELDPESVRRFAEALSKLDEEIGDRGSFHDDPEMAICDLRVAEWAVYALPGAGLLERVPLFKKFRDVYGVEPASLPNLVRFLEPWNARLG